MRVICNSHYRYGSRHAFVMLAESGRIVVHADSADAYEVGAFYSLTFTKEDL